MTPAKIEEVVGVAQHDDVLHIWKKYASDYFVALCDPEFHTDKVLPNKKGAICIHCDALVPGYAVKG